MQILPQKNWVYLILFVLSSIGAVSMKLAGIQVSNAIVNVLVFMPFFLIGVLMKPLKTLLSQLNHILKELALLCASVVFVVVCGNVNGYVWMYLCEYGNYFILYMLGGMAGTTLLYVLSLWLSRFPYRQMIQSLSKGSIVIIGLHIIIVRRLTELPDRIWAEDLLFAVIILFAFLPIIRLAELFCPILLGRGKVINKN